MRLSSQSFNCPHIRIKSTPELVSENALLGQQLVVLRRSVKRPRCTLADRVRAWRSALPIVPPDTLLRRHRQLFRECWWRKSRPAPRGHRPKVSAETIALIQGMAAANRRWGAERIRGELGKLDIRVAKWTVQKYLRAARPPRHAGQPWATFLPVTAALFRPLCACFVIALDSRRVVHVGVTRHPTDAWVARQLREATPFDQRPRFLIRDNDSKYGRTCARVAAASGITVLRTAYRAPRQNATCERFLSSVRRECLDHALVLGERHLRRVLREYVAYCNGERPHQGRQQRIPDGPERPAARAPTREKVGAIPVLGGLHHTDQRAA